MDYRAIFPTEKSQYDQLWNTDPAFRDLSMKVYRYLDYVEESLYKQPRESLTTGGTTYSEAKEFSEDITRLLLMLEARTRVFKELLTK